jgi:hypothetical protein
MLRQMAGLVKSPYDKMMERRERQLIKQARALQEQNFLIEMISRREQGIEGTVPMPMRKILGDMEKMAKGEI